ncbi:Oxysterol-binding protein-domain-containing protein [Phycomyces blakesleeanus]
MPEICIQPRDVYEHHINISNNGTCLHWEFSTKKKNIAFGLIYYPHPSSSPNISQREENEEDDEKDNSRSALALPDHLHIRIPKDIHEISYRNSLPVADKQSVTILPLSHVNSSAQTITGSHTVTEPGDYVLIFDNTFSFHASKVLSFTVTSDEDEPPASIISGMTGWLLKKRRKRMQGWAKRWFELSSTGVLSYSIDEKSIKRGSIHVNLSTLAIYPKQRTLHIDSGTVIYHLKALTAESFEAWIEAFRASRATCTSPSKAPGILVDGSWLLADGHISHSPAAPSFANTSQVQLNKSIAEISDEIKSLEQVILDFKNILDKSAAASTIEVVPSTPPPTIKKRFPFRRGSSGSSVLPFKIACPSLDIIAQQGILERLTQSVKALVVSRDAMLAALEEQQTLWDNSVQRSIPDDPRLLMPQEQYPGNRAPSFYSYQTSIRSELFYDAQDDFVLSEDEEEDAVVTHGSSDSEEEGCNTTDIDTLEETDKITNAFVELSQPDVQVVRRTRLPSTVVGNVSLLAILRKNIGKDLSTISMPVGINEPLNLLQRLCEELEYSELLEKASAQTESIDRLMYVAVFAVSGYSATNYRLGRKLFNPLMSETFECIRPDKGFRFISEKVSHSPAVMACHAESKSFQFWQTSLGKTKFWGKSMELIFKGAVHVTLTGHSDGVFSYTKPSSWLRNMMAGCKYLEHVGEMRVQNEVTGEYAIVTFKGATGGGFFGGLPTDRNSVVISCHGSDGQKLREVQGKWSEELWQMTGETKSRLWKSQPPPFEDNLSYYGFTQFAMELNEISSLEDAIPPTDTRLRPDQRLFEQGQVDEADDVKLRIEQQQRERRKDMELQGEQWNPLWFESHQDPNDPLGETWKYKGGYWEARRSKKWPSDMLTLW